VCATISRPCLLRFLDFEEADMVHRPRSVIGYVFLVLGALGSGYVLLSLLDALPGMWVWGSLAVIVVVSLVVVTWRRRVEAARERAWVGSFSFAEVVNRRRAEDPLRRAETAG
jgi:hypothetical protein